MKETRFKQTEIGLIPENWEVSKLGEKCLIYRGGSPRPIENYITNNADGINWIKIGDVESDSKYIIKTKEKIKQEGVIRSRAVYAGDLILSNSMSFGRPYILKINGCIHDGWLVIQEYIKNFDLDYLYYLLGSAYVFRQYTQMAAGSSVQNLNKDKVSSVIVSIPTKKEQNKIASALTSIDNLLLSLDKLIEKKRLIKQGAMQELLTGKKRLPGFTGEWKASHLGELCIIKDGTHQTPRYVENGIPFFSVENVTNNNFKRVKYITSEDHNILTKNYRIEKGDVLMTRIGSIGICKYIDWDVNASFYVSLALLKFKEPSLAKFFSFYSMTERFIKDIESNSLQFASPKKINLSNISLVRIEYPTSKDEMEAITIILSSIDKELESLKGKKAKYEQIKQGMMQQLLTGKIRLIS